jgi:hypothetical protein
VTESPVMRDGRALICIRLAQVLNDVLPVRPWLLLVADDVQRQWHGHLRRVQEADDGAVELQREWERRVASSPHPTSAVELFTDHYTMQVEGEPDLVDELRALIWLSHAMSLGEFMEQG